MTDEKEVCALCGGEMDDSEEECFWDDICSVCEVNIHEGNPIAICGGGLTVRLCKDCKGLGKVTFQLLGASKWVTCGSCYGKGTR